MLISPSHSLDVKEMHLLVWPRPSQRHDRRQSWPSRPSLPPVLPRPQSELSRVSFQSKSMSHSHSPGKCLTSERILFPQLAKEQERPSSAAATLLLRQAYLWLEKTRFSSFTPPESCLDLKTAESSLLHRASLCLAAQWY